MSKPEAEKIFDDHCNNFEPKDLEAQYEKMMAKPHNFMVIDYRRPLDQRITERFTKVIHPKGAVPIEIKHESESDEPAI